MTENSLPQRVTVKPSTASIESTVAQQKDYKAAAARSLETINQWNAQISEADREIAEIRAERNPTLNERSAQFLKNRNDVMLTGIKEAGVLGNITRFSIIPMVALGSSNLITGNYQMAIADAIAATFLLLVTDLTLSSNGKKQPTNV